MKKFIIIMSSVILLIVCSYIGIKETVEKSEIEKKITMNVTFASSYKSHSADEFELNKDMDIVFNIKGKIKSGDLDIKIVSYDDSKVYYDNANNKTFDDNKKIAFPKGKYKIEILAADCIEGRYKIQGKIL